MGAAYHLYFAKQAITMPDDEYLAEHRHLLHVLHDNNRAAEQREYAKQRHEVKTELGVDVAKAAADSESRAQTKAQHYGVGERTPSESKTRTQAAWETVNKLQGLAGADKREAKIRIRQRARELGIDTSGWSRDAQKRAFDFAGAANFAMNAAETVAPVAKQLWHNTAPQRAIVTNTVKNYGVAEAAKGFGALGATKAVAGVPALAKPSVHKALGAVTQTSRKMFGDDSGITNFAKHLRNVANPVTSIKTAQLGNAALHLLANH